MFNSSKGSNTFPSAIEQQNISLFTARATLEELVLLKKIKLNHLFKILLIPPIYLQFTINLQVVP